MTLRICPKRDTVCPHGMSCPYVIDQYSCRIEDPDAREWLILKNGYFYRPNRSGYTQKKAAAGRYTRAEADREAAVEPESFTVLHESEIPDAPQVVDLRVELAAARRLIRDTHRNPVVHKDCDTPHCPICEGGLFVCADCGAAEIEAEQRICTSPQKEADALRRVIQEIMSCPTGIIGQRLGDQHPTLRGVAWDEILHDPVSFVRRLP